MMVTNIVRLKYVSHPVVCLAVPPQTKKQAPGSKTTAFVLVITLGRDHRIVFVLQGKTARRVLPRPEYPVNIPSLLTSHRADLVGLPRRRFPALPNSAYHPGDACLLAAGTDPGAFTATSYSRCPYRNELGQGWWPRGFCRIAPRGCQHTGGWYL